MEDCRSAWRYIPSTTNEQPHNCTQTHSIRCQIVDINTGEIGIVHLQYTFRARLVSCPFVRLLTRKQKKTETCRLSDVGLSAARAGVTGVPSFSSGFSVVFCMFKISKNNRRTFRKSFLLIDERQCRSLQSIESPYT